MDGHILVALAAISLVAAQDLTTGRVVANNCPPLEAQPQAQVSATGRVCQWIITLDAQGCRRISQDCASQPLCQNVNEVFWQCAQDCEPSCDGTAGRSCLSTCQRAKCQCAPGFLRTRTGQCVPRGSCPASQNPTPTCSFGEVLVRQNCSRIACERNCNGQTTCNRQCNQLMCLCADGFFRDSNSRSCVSSFQCNIGNQPQGCTRDADCRGNQICQNNRCNNGCTSNSQCSSGLLCQSGRCTIPVCNRDSDCPRGTRCTGNRCTVVSNQPGQCTSDSQCGQNGICVNFQCRLGCRNNNVCAPGFGCFNMQCLRRCNSNFNCQAGTRCQNGFCVSGSGNQCRRNEVFRSCASACEPTCFQRNTVCTAQCLPGRCQCNSQFVRDRFGNCVLPNQCF